MRNLDEMTKRRRDGAVVKILDGDGTEKPSLSRLLALARSLDSSLFVHSNSLVLVRSLALSPLRSLARSFVRSFARSLARSLIRLTRSRQGDPVSVFPTRPPHVAARRRKRRARHLRVVGGPRRSSSCPSSLPSLSSSSSTSCSSSVAVCLSCSASVDRDSSHLPTITRICREDKI